MNISELPSDPEAFCEVVGEGNLTMEVLEELLTRHGNHNGACDQCNYIWEEGLGSGVAEFLIATHSRSVEPALVEKALSQIAQASFDNVNFDSYLAIALTPNSNRETFDQAFEFLEDYALYAAFMRDGDLAGTLAKVASHPLGTEDDVRRWISRDHEMYLEAFWEGHDEDEDSCELCQQLFTESWQSK